MHLHTNIQRLHERPVDMCWESRGPLQVRRKPGDAFVARAGRVYIRRSYGGVIELPDPYECAPYLAQRRQGVRMALAQARTARRYGEHPWYRGEARRAVDLALREYRTAWRCLHQARALQAEARAACDVASAE